MEELLLKLVESASKNKKAINQLKVAAVTCQQFEIASQLRMIEKENFPESEEVKQAKEQAKKLNLLFRMVDLNISEEICWVIYETLKVYNEMKEDVSIKDVSKILTKKEEIFS